MITKHAPSFPVSIFIAGDPGEARRICRQFCDEEGLCVTVTPTTYVYTGGEEAGVIVGLINYPRFSAGPRAIETKARSLGMLLKAELGQESFSIQTPTETTWFSWREADNTPDRSGEADKTGTGLAEGESGLPEGSSN